MVGSPIIQINAGNYNDVPASPNLILSVLINGRTLWDPNVIGIKRVGPSGQNFDIVRFQYKPTLITLGKCSFLAR
uniref:Uncharacterized protein n=1 Tax=Meloidogyne javanica TaxID=6303 RepID=A0A915LTN1_MELJA